MVLLSGEHYSTFFVAQTIILYHEVIHFLCGEAIGCKDWIISPCFIFHVIKSASVGKKKKKKERKKKRSVVSWRSISGELAFLITVHYFNNSINLWQLEHLRVLSQPLSSAFATNTGWWESAGERIKAGLEGERREERGRSNRVRKKRGWESREVENKKRGRVEQNQEERGISAGTGTERGSALVSPPSVINC